MSLKQVLRSALDRSLDTVGYRLARKTVLRGMRDAIEHWAPTTEIRTVIDVGASDGRWAREAIHLLPGARFLLVEAQRGPHERGLVALRSEHPNVDFILAAASDSVGSAHFDAEMPFGGVLSDSSTGGHDIVVPTTTLDAAVEARGLEGPFLVKLDTHGVEARILSGAEKTLRSATLVVIEAYNFQLTPECLRWHELVSLMERSGFRCLDAVDIMRRPGDGALWQMDLIFAPASRSEFASNTYLPGSR